ncbi:uncharacterized protein LOC110979947 [Acanthaster planci]|uniref:Uncharacterized protein LOC110979947 n=1 Tax=Acanthaster planci TaxID=133434 RepID=A0A8B7YF23_ACAPL|nr:uncharacterized protein LOC110979947 [Acanthaster planci]
MSHQEEESKGVHQPHMIPVQHDEVEESLDRVEEIHDEVKQAQKDEFQNSRGGISDTNDGQACDVELSLEVESANWVPNEISAEVNHFLRHGSGEMGALEVPPEVQGEAIKDEAKEKRKIEYDQNLKDGEDEDESCSEENTDDDDDNLVTSEEDELDSMVGYVINSAGSSLTNNFDVFTFKSFHINENITSRKEGPEEDSIILDGDAAPDAEEVLLIHSGDENLRGETLNVSDVYAGDDVIEASDMFRQGTCFVAADSSSVKHEDTEGVNDKICASFKNVDNVTLRVEEANERKKTDDDSLHDKCSTEKPQDDSFSRSVENRKPLEIKVTDNAADLIGLEGTHESLEQGSPTWSKKQEDAMCVKKQENDGGPSLTHTAEVLEANLQLPPIDTVCRTSKVQSQEVTETLLQKLENDLPKCNKEEKTSSVTDMTSSVNGPKVTLTVSNIASDSDDDDDLYDTERKPSVNINTAENDWECLAIQQISKSQPHVWYPTYNTTHHIVEDASKTQHNNTGKHLDADTLKMNIPSKVPSNEKVTSTHDVSESTVTAKSLSSHNLTTGQSMPSVSSQAPASQPDLPETESGMAVINDRLRKKIVLLERRLKELALELTFLGDRNWRLEAYIDCLIKTLEVLEVTDVVDLDQKKLPLSLFKVKVKAGYKLGSYNGIPSRALQSYKKEGRQPPYVDLSGWGDTDKPTQRPDLIDPTPLPSCDDDVGLSVSQMYHYESQLEEISIQNQILEGQLQEANELVQSMMGESSADERQTGPQDLHQAKQQKEQGIQTRPHDTSTLPQNVGVLQQQVQDLRDEYHQGGQEYWQQPQQEQQQQLFLTGVMPQIQTQPECYAMHEGEQYSLPQQQLQHYQLQHCQPVVQPQQQQLQQPQQQAWNPQAVQEETVLPNCCDWESNEKLSLHDPLEWPTLTESQAQVTGRSQTGTGTEAGPRPLQLQTQPFATTGPASHVSESSPTVLSNPVKDKSTLHSSLEQPASSGSIPNHENRCKASCYHDNNPKEASSSGTVSSQSFYRGRRFESDSRGQPRYNHRSLEQSLSGIDTLPRGHRLEESMRFEHWDPHVDRLSSLIPGEFPVDLHGEAWRKERSPYHDVRNAPSRHPLPFQRNLDRSRRFFHCDSVLDSYCPDFSNFQHAPTFKEDLGETISASNSQFMLSNGYAFDKFPSPPSTRGFSSLGSSTSTGALPYPRQHKRQSTPTRRGKPWTRAGSCTSPLRSRHNPEVTLSDSK